MSAALSLPEVFAALQRKTYRQGNWKREMWVATEYEIRMAIDELLLEEKITVSAGVLAMPERPTKPRLALAFVPETPEQKWAREDDELRAICQQIATHAGAPGVHSTDDDDIIVPAAGGSAGFSGIRGEPRGVSRYVLRELKIGASTFIPIGIRRIGPATDTNVARWIEAYGGIEWVLEDPRADAGKSKRARKAKPRR